MTKDQLITKQQLQIEQYKKIMTENEKVVSRVKGRFYSIGQPLNDNVLQFNRDQLLWCQKTLDAIEEIQTTTEDEEGWKET